MEQKKWSTAVILSFFLGVLGIDRLYLGYKLWWVKLITVGGLGIWALYDFIMILLNKLPDANGQPLAK
jgi:TM2 domain-containing membrane protein YozV